MKRLIAIVILVALLAGCDGGTAEAAIPPAGSGMSAGEILDNFEAVLEPIAEHFQVTRLPEVELDERNTCLPIVVTDSMLGRSYHVTIYYTQTRDVYRVTLDTDRSNGTELNFALLSVYLYSSLNLPEMDAQAFYDHFNMLSAEPEGWMKAEAWELLVLHTDDLLSLIATYSPK